ncbi:MAG: MGMT family protein [Patescibacteria group bacterium]|nr:MGMT family protein [Patescibacteria group bacterium]MCL5257764.1 MGMT family protein [Patescibacteria group bacterium]
MTSFEKKIFQTARKIPKGKVTTYKTVAIKAGRAKSWRAVGNTLNKNNDPKIPCHRIIRNNGEVGGYNKGMEVKLKKLKREGVKIDRSGRIDLKKFLFKL